MPVLGKRAVVLGRAWAGCSPRGCVPISSRPSLWSSVTCYRMKPATGGESRGVDMSMPSRPFLESHVRRRVHAIPNVRILGGQDVAELTATTDRNRVTGVRVVNHEGGAKQELTADVVMDAMGRGCPHASFPGKPRAWATS